MNKLDKKEETNNDLKFLRCAFGYENAHFVEKPIQLSCNHSACDMCFAFFKENSAEKELECNICKKKISLESNFDYSLTTKNLIEYNFNKLINNLKSEFKETLKNYRCKIKLTFKNRIVKVFFLFLAKITTMNNFIDLQIHYAKNEINIRANLLKDEIEEIKALQNKMLDKIKEEFLK